MAGHKTTLEQWRILQAVVDHGGYFYAAEALHRSQSSLNHAVKKLEHQLGVTLLEVKGRKAFLTPAGEVLLRRSRLLTDTALALEVLAENMDMGWEPELKIAVEAIYPRDLLFRALAKFYPESRGTRIRIMDTVLTGGQDHILNQSADLVIAGMLPKGYIGETLCQIEFVLVVHQSHPLAQLTQPISQQALINQMQVVIKDNGLKPDESRGWLKSEQRWTVDSFERAKQVLKLGLGFCWLPRHEVLQELAEGHFTELKVHRYSNRTAAVFLVIPNPDRLGPGGQHLYEQIKAEGQTPECQRALGLMGVQL